MVEQKYQQFNNMRYVYSSTEVMVFGYRFADEKERNLLHEKLGISTIPKDVKMFHFPDRSCVTRWSIV